MSEIALYPAFGGFSLKVIANYNRHQAPSFLALIDRLDIQQHIVEATLTTSPGELEDLRSTDLWLIDISENNQLAEQIYRFDALSRRSHKVFIEYEFSQDRQKICSDLNYSYYNYAGDIDNACRLIREEALEIKATELGNSGGGNIATYGEFASRLDSIADSLASFRINSLSDQIFAIRQVAAKLHVKELHREVSDPVAVQIHARTILHDLHKIYDAFDNSKTASVIVSGVVGYLMTGGGWSGIAAQALALGAWQGKDAFIAVVNKLTLGQDMTQPPKIETKRRGPRKRAT